MSNSLDPDQTRRFVGPDLGPNCLQMLSADVGKELLGLNSDLKVLSILLFYEIYIFCKNGKSNPIHHSVGSDELTYNENISISQTSWK